MTLGATLVVIAKAPVAGRSKTRLCPPCTPEQAARLAEAALSDTLRAVAAVGVRRRLLALDGEPGAWIPAGFDVLRQRGEGLAERLANAVADAGGPALVVGMDTPQATTGVLETAVARLLEPDVDAALGPAPDGGYWAIGLRHPDPAAFEGVPMSTEETGAAQLRRLRELGLRTALLPPLRDVDTIADAHAVAAARPGSAFARELGALGLLAA